MLTVRQAFNDTHVKYLIETFDTVEFLTVKVSRKHYIESVEMGDKIHKFTVDGSFKEFDICQKTIKSRGKKSLEARVFDMNSKIKDLEDQGIPDLNIRKLLNLYNLRNKDLLQYLIFKSK